MDYILRQKLPSELVDKIAFNVWKLNMRSVHVQILYCVVKIYVPKTNEYCFIASKNHNYYASLLRDTELKEFQIISGRFL